MQNKHALADAGIPNCISWQSIGEIEIDGHAVDIFVLNSGEDGAAQETSGEQVA